MTTQEIIDGLKTWIPLSSPLDKFINRAVDRLEELQMQSAAMVNERNNAIQENLELVVQLRQTRDDRDESRTEAKGYKEAIYAMEKEGIDRRAEMERLKTENQRLKNLVGEMIEEEADGRDTSLTRPESSRLEIAAMLLAHGWLDRSVEQDAKLTGWALAVADALIAAAKEAN
jgi:hypothetical protein